MIFHRNETQYEKETKGYEPMKKTVLLLLALILLSFLAVPAPAEETEVPMPEGYSPKREDNMYLGVGVTQIEETGPDGEAYKAYYQSGELKTLTVSKEDASGKVLSAVFNPKGKITRAIYGSGDEQLSYKSGRWTDRAGNRTTGPDMDYMSDYYDYYPKFETWYRNNTMGLIGLYLKELKPELTDKWYMIVPVDLREWGTYRYPCAASNLFYLGAVDVTISTKNVKVDYVLPKGLIYPQKTCMRWFTSLDEITPEFLETLESPYRFGEQVSREDQLKGHDIVLLFICNHINYRIPLAHNGQKTAVRYYRGKEDVKKLAEKYRKLYQEMQELYPEGT